MSFGENFAIFLILTLFVSFGGVKTHFLHLKSFSSFEIRFFKRIGGYFEITLPLQPPIKSP
ncbi:hypothetical protein EXS98_05830 [Helicobacter pylori]|nr:hypothetical protein [Helicobacter pylori]